MSDFNTTLRYSQLVTPPAAPSPSLSRARSILEGGSLGADWKGVLGRRDLLGRRRLDGIKVRVKVRVRVRVRVSVRVKVRVRVRFRFRVRVRVRVRLGRFSPPCRS